MNPAESLFLRTAVPAAIQSQKLTGVPASITIAQAILESGWGQSALARQANNYFGIKALAHVAPDQYREFRTEEFVDGHKQEVMAAFARYATPAESFAAHARLLLTATRYRPAMLVSGNAQAFAEKLQACGYSTNPAYASSLMKLVREFDLTQYDNEPGPPAQAKETAA